MKSWLKRRKTEITIFLLALIPRLAFMFTAFFILGDYGFRRGQDGYLAAGLNLLIHGVFGGDRITVIAHSFPAPLYPIATAFSWLIIPRFLFIVFWQNILYSLFIVFIYKFAKLFFNNYISIGAALFMALEPFSILWSNVVMSETLFMFLFMLSVYLLALFWRGQKNKHLVYSSILLGLAALTRPIVVFFYPVIIFSFVVFFWQKISWRRILKSSLIYLIIFLIVIAPWCIRNKVRFDSYTISNLPHYLYFLTTSRDFLILNEGMSQAEADDYLQKLAVEKAGVESFDEILYVDKYIPILKEISFSLIKNQPLAYLKWHMIKSIPVLTDSGWLRMMLFWGIDLGKPQSITINISNLIIQGDIKTIISFLGSNRVFLIRIIGIGFWLLIDLVALIGIVLMIKKRELFKIALMLFAIIIYFVFASSWAALARLRLPFQPFLFIFFFYAVYRISRGKYENN